MSCCSTCSSPLDSPPLSAPPTPPSASAEVSPTVKLPGIRDLFPDHLQLRGALSDKTAGERIPRPHCTPIIVQPDYDEPQDVSPLQSDPTYISSALRYFESATRLRRQSASDALPRPNDHTARLSPPSSSQRHQEAPYRRRAQTVVDNYSSAYGRSAPNSPSSPPRVQPRIATHVCDLCGKRFDRPSSLKTHYNSHTGLTPFKCPWPHCGREFNVKSNMRRHYRKHQGFEQVQQPSLQALDPHAPLSLLLRPQYAP